MLRHRPECIHEPSTHPPINKPIHPHHTRTHKPHPRATTGTRERALESSTACTGPPAPPPSDSRTSLGASSSHSLPMLLPLRRPPACPPPPPPRAWGAAAGVIVGGSDAGATSTSPCSSSEAGADCRTRRRRRCSCSCCAISIEGGAASLLSVVVCVRRAFGPPCARCACRRVCARASCVSPWTKQPSAPQTYTQSDRLSRPARACDCPLLHVSLLSWGFSGGTKSALFADFMAGDMDPHCTLL